MFNGLASEQNRSLTENTWSNDTSYQINEHHPLKGGSSVTSQIESVASATTAFQTDSSGNVPSDVPITIVDGQDKEGYLYGVYLADQWQATGQLTGNYGCRFDQVSEYVSENQFRPESKSGLSSDSVNGPFHGVFWFFVPTQEEYLPPSSVQKYLNTTAATAVTFDDKPKAGTIELL